jgi:hypothetical protein
VSISKDLVVSVGVFYSALAGIAPGSALTFFASPKKVSKERRAGFAVPPLATTELNVHCQITSPGPFRLEYELSNA